MSAESVGAPSRAGLELPYCDECGEWQMAARQFCAAHPDIPLATRRLSGHGEIYSYTVSHVAMAPSVAELLPYTAVLVLTDEGLRILAHLAAGATPRIGSRVLVSEVSEAEAAGLPGGGRRVAAPEEPS